MRKHIVKLSKKVRSELEELVRTGTHPVRVVRRANTLLKTDAGLTDEQIGEHVGCTARCVAEIRRPFAQLGSVAITEASNRVRLAPAGYIDRIVIQRLVSA